MLDLTSFQAAAASFQTAGTILKAIAELRDTAKVHEKVMELRGVIIDAQAHTMNAQAASFAQVDRIRELEERIVKMENWDGEKQRYELRELKQGVLAYALKEGMSQGEPAHHLCAKCYQDGVKSILQPEHLDIGRVQVLVCNRCGSDLITSGTRMSSSPRSRTRR
jgi:hypothetical protein